MPTLKTKLHFQGAFLWTSGDCLSQLLEGKRVGFCRALREDEQPFSWTRLSRMMIYGALVAGPVYTWWYALLDRKALPLAKGPLYPHLWILLHSPLAQ
jgi:hypothetical protein